MTFSLRPYQAEATKKAVSFMKGETKSKSALVLPCAAGKSWIISAVAKELQEPVLVIQPSVELLFQNYEKYIRMGGVAEIYSAGAGLKAVGSVTFATIGSIKKDVHSFRKIKLKYIIIDECHYNTKINSMVDKFIKQVGVTKVLGLTATPVELANNISLGTHLKMINRSRNNIFSSILHVTQIQEMVDGKYWSELVYQIEKVDKTMLKYNSNGSEFTDASIDRFYTKNDLDNKILNNIDNYLSLGYKSILVSVPSVSDAKRLSAFNKDMFRCLSSNDSKGVRQEIVDDFINKRINVVFQVRILGVGFDFPELDVVIMASPTNSVAVYYQLAGRVVRIHDNKKHGIILDMAGNVERFGKLEDITFEDVENYGWGMFTKGKLMSNVSLSGGYRLDKNTLVKLPKKNETFNTDFMPFGKYKDTPIKDVDEVSYLLWCYHNWDFKKIGDKGVGETIKKNIYDRIQVQTNQ